MQNIQVLNVNLLPVFNMVLCNDVLLNVLSFGTRRQLVCLEPLGVRLLRLVSSCFNTIPFLRLNIGLNISGYVYCFWTFLSFLLVTGCVSLSGRKGCSRHSLNSTTFLIISVLRKWSFSTANSMSSVKMKLIHKSVNCLLKISFLFDHFLMILYQLHFMDLLEAFQTALLPPKTFLIMSCINWCQLYLLRDVTSLTLGCFLISQAWTTFFIHFWIWTLFDSNLMLKYGFLWT